MLLAAPFSAIGAVVSLYLLGYPMSPAVWVGMIALLGVDAETGTFMVMYLDLAWSKAIAEDRMRTHADLRHAVFAGAVRRIRPKAMTVSTMFLGLAPILWSTGAGAEVMKRIAAPMVGGLATSFLMELIIYPMLYERWRSRYLSRAGDALNSRRGYWLRNGTRWCPFSLPRPVTNDAWTRECRRELPLL